MATKKKGSGNKVSDAFESAMPKKLYGPDNSATRRSLDKTSGWNNNTNRAYNLAMDGTNKRVKKATSSLFYYASGEARKIVNNTTGQTVKASTLVGKTGRRR